MGGVTTPNALRQLLELKKRWANLSVRFVNSRFHLKSFLFQSNTLLKAIIRSANLTGSGLSDDGEQSLLVTVPHWHRSVREMKAPFDEFWGDEHVTMDLTEDVIKEYSKHWNPRFNIEKAISIKRTGGQLPVATSPHKRVKFNYFYLPERMTPKKKSHNWEGSWVSYGVRYNIADIDIVVAYRPRAEDVAPRDFSHELRKIVYKFSLTEQRNKPSRISSQLFAHMENIIKKIG